MLKSRQFWLALLILLLTITASIGTYQRWWAFLLFRIGPFSFGHWLGWVGAAFIALFNPLYSYLKRHAKKISQKKLFMTHIFGNLSAYFLISVHFAQQESRPSEFEAVHSTGLVLFITVTTLIVTGFFQRFGVFRSQLKTWKFIHTSLILTFYMVVITHILQFYGFL